jgi:hypothetical protein
MQRDADFDPIDTVVRDALRFDRATARRLAAQALTERAISPRFIPALAVLTLIIAAAVGVTRHATSDPPIVIRGEGDTIVIERGSGSNKTTEILRDDSPRGGVVVIREGGD